MIKVHKIFLIIIIFYFTPFFANAATLFISPSSGTFEVGDRVTTKVFVSSDVSVNAVSGLVSFPSIFSIESISRSESVINFWATEPSFSKGNGIAIFEGVSLSGFSGRNGNIVTIILRATKEGSGLVKFEKGQVLANDGQGTDVTSGLGSASFSVVPKKITQPKTTVEEPIKEKVEEKILKDEPQKAPSLDSPKIDLIKRLGEDSILGTSIYENSKALVIFVSESGTKIYVQGDTDDRGNFIIPVPSTLKQGKYKVTSIVIRQDLSNSTPSNEIEVRVGNIFSDTSLEVKIFILLLILLIIYSIFRIGIYLKVIRERKAYIKKESLEAQDHVHEAFDAIEESLSGKKRIKDIKEIKETLKEAEDEIIKEIKEIEK